VELEHVGENTSALAEQHKDQKLQPWVLAAISGFNQKNSNHGNRKDQSDGLTNMEKHK
jgi:hypothetical protein